ncbi:class I SAM-dependent methyltransferase [Roseibium sp. RKSG952]|uniref:class I SAM-dependent methyltransferase n=1 Tax=Roseibium sp. RKSG952 TaxID=2529384 RepID=UPI0018AD1724
MAPGTDGGSCMPFSMNSFTGKSILALVRDEDFAHAGEAEAIDLALEGIPKTPDRAILDVGCGRGGTANYMYRQGWGHVTGFDLDGGSILHAQKTYPEGSFLSGDALTISEELDGGFGLITLFNVLYAITDQATALRQLAQLARADGQLILFDYIDPHDYSANPIAGDRAPFLPNPPLKPALADLLDRAGWRLDTYRDVTGNYVRWYRDLVKRIDDKRDQIEGIAGADGFAFVASRYKALLAALEEGRLEGVIVQAVRQTG